jgi:ADP-heptose:LPS heptosyltransferase
MISFQSLLRKVVYLPLHPTLFKGLVNLLRTVGWLGRDGVSKSTTAQILVALPHNSLGDFLLTIPFLEYLHRLWPEALIDVVIGDGMVTLFQKMPFVHRVMTYTPPPTSKSTIYRYQGIWRLLALAHREQLSGIYDVALDPRWDSDSYGYLGRALLYLSAAKSRVAYSGHVDGIDPSIDAFLTHAGYGGANEHELVRKLQLLKRAGLTEEEVDESIVLRASATVIQLGKAGEVKVRQLLQEVGIAPGDRYAILAPAATSPRRIWPVERLAAVAESLKEEYHFRFVVIGGRSDIPIAARVAALQPKAIVSLAGKTNIPELAALLANAAIFIGNDSGPAHLSGLLGTNTVVASPFPLSCDDDHINAPSRFRPCGPRVRVVQPLRPLAPCDPTCGTNTAHCICQITAEEMLAACEDLLQHDERRYSGKHGL